LNPPQSHETGPFHKGRIYCLPGSPPQGANPLACIIPVGESGYGRGLYGFPVLRL
jgi:hypothetical protein